MFAIGFTGIDLNADQRYFDILMVNRTNNKNGSTTVKSNQTVPLKACSFDQWSGVTDSITDSYDSIGFEEWLCP